MATADSLAERRRSAQDALARIPRLRREEELPDLDGALVEERLAAWIADDEELHAPALVHYEVASGLRKAIMSGRMRPEQIRPAVALAEALSTTSRER